MQAIAGGAAAPAPRPMDAMSLPNDARYGADAILLKSSRVTSKFFPQNAGDFGPAISRTIRFDISSTDFLDLSEARLVATMKKTSAQSAVLDGGMGGCIQRISVMNASGQLLERIDDYNLLQTVLIQCSDRARDEEAELWVEEAFVSPATKLFGQTAASCIINGGGQTGATLTVDNVVIPQGIIPAGTQVTIGATTHILTQAVTSPGVPANGTNVTLHLSPNITVAQNDNVALTFKNNHYIWEQDDTRELNHKMHGAWFQTHKQKLLPPGLAFQLEIELVDNGNQCFASDNATDQTWTWSNVFFNIPTVKIMSQSFEDSTARMLSRGYSWTGSTYRRYALSRDAAAGQTSLTVPDKSLALTGLIALSRRTAELNQSTKYQNYFRDGNAFTQVFNVQIGSQQYPASKIDYTGAGDFVDLSVGENGAASIELSRVSAQIKAVLGAIPHDPEGKNFSKRANTAVAGVPGRGLGFVAVQVGFPEGGQGIDTQSASLPVLLDVSNATNGAASTLTVYAQATAMFRMDPGQGMLNVVSFI